MRNGVLSGFLVRPTLHIGPAYRPLCRGPGSGDLDKRLCWSPSPTCSTIRFSSGAYPCWLWLRLACAGTAGTEPPPAESLSPATIALEIRHEQTSCGNATDVRKGSIPDGQLPRLRGPLSSSNQTSANPSLQLTWMCAWIDLSTPLRRTTHHLILRDARLDIVEQSL